ncbi:PLP-dependent aminotransferase family protein [Rosistilla oblonga]|uniref:aminotransferase-like domain-containing protein n=1 Tax=Rosistilla oblonga TaxID=2527990 RepID=UPI003A986AC5
MNLHNSTHEQLLSPRGTRASEQPISQLMSAALANPGIISLAAGFVDNATLPLEFVSEAAQNVLGDTATGRLALQYGTNNGPQELRQAIARRNFSNNADDLADRMILTAGSNQLLHLVAECVFDEGDIVLCAAPTYFVFLGLLKDMGVRAFGIEADDQGMIPESLDQGLQQLADNNELHRVKSVYLIPYCDNPGGSTVPEARRQELIAVMKKWQQQSPILLLVDNAYRDLRYSGEDIPTLTDLGADPELTVESGTFSKNFGPGIRVGWGVMPRWLFDSARRFKSVIDFGSAHLNQQLMLNILKSGRFDEQVQRLQTAYAGKLQVMLEACDTHLAGIPGVEYRRPIGGLYVWLELPPGVDAGSDSPLWKQCIERGVLYVPGEFCYPSEGAAVRKNTIRLSFGVQPESQIRDGIKLLSEAITAVMNPANV